MRVTVLGAAREVTGSCYLVETADVRFLVDCGMFQGGRDIQERNRAEFGFRPVDIDFVIVTHAHIDHSGLLPKLTRSGFSGPIHCTEATADLLAVMLPDSGHIQESDARRRLRDRRERAQSAVRPLYTVADAHACLTQVSRHAYDQDLMLDPRVRCRFRDAGHILGSSILELWIEEGGVSKKLVFSGDLGQPGRPILREPQRIEDADFLFVESTYGDRDHDRLDDTLDQLVAVIERTLHEKRGCVVIPAFAVGRSQEIIYYLHELTRQGRLSGLKIFLDSPMATEVTQLTMRHLDLFDEQAARLAAWRTAGVGLPGMHFTRSVEESIALNRIQSGAIIISASGMCEAGRIKHHLRHRLPNPADTILIVGFQARGTLGRRLVDGAAEVRIFGDPVPVRAEIAVLNGLSAHADRSALLDWARGFTQKPERAFVVHGEDAAAQAMVESLKAELDWRVHAPERGEVISLSKEQP